MAWSWLSVRSSHSANELGGWSPQSQSPSRDGPPYGQADAIKDHREVGRQRGRIGVLAGLAPVTADLRLYAESGSEDTLTDCDSARAATTVVARVSFRAMTFASSQAWSSIGVSLALANAVRTRRSGTRPPRQLASA